MAKKRSFRSTPNILVTGTPGTGKTTFSRMLHEATGFRHVNVGDWVKERQLHTGWDDEHQCFTLDEDKVPGTGLLPLHVMSRRCPAGVTVCAAA
jgi:adenylate kinase